MLTVEYINIILYAVILFLFILSMKTIKSLINYNDSKKMKITLSTFLIFIVAIIVFNYYYISKNKEIYSLYSQYTKEEIELYTSFYLDYNQEQRDNLFLIEVPFNFIKKEKGYILRLNVENLEKSNIDSFESFCAYNQLPCQLDINKDKHILLTNKSIYSDKIDDYIFVNSYYKERYLELPYLEKNKNIYKKLYKKGFNIVDYGLEIVTDKKHQYDKEVIYSNYITISIYKDDILSQNEKKLIYDELSTSINTYNINIRVIKEETKEMIDNFKLYEFEK